MGHRSPGGLFWGMGRMRKRNGETAGDCTLAQEKGELSEGSIP